jgi:hypothetical protein
MSRQEATRLRRGALSPQDSRLLQEEWRQSPEYAKAKHDMALSIIFALALFAVGGWNVWVNDLTPPHDGSASENSMSAVLSQSGFVALFAGTALAASAYLKSGRMRAEFTQRERVLEIAEDVQETVREADPEPTMSNLILINRTEMSGYHQLTIDQATKSFRHSQIAMYLGLTVVIGCVLLVAVSSLDTGVKIAITALGAVSTAVAGYLTSTFLKVHAVSITQLNRFFEQPLVSSYLLSAERVAQQLQDTSREAALRRVVDQALRAAVTERDVATIAGLKRERRLHQPQEPEPSPASVDGKS